MNSRKHCTVFTTIKLTNPVAPPPAGPQHLRCGLVVSRSVFEQIDAARDGRNYSAPDNTVDLKCHFLKNQQKQECENRLGAHDVAHGLQRPRVDIVCLIRTAHGRPHMSTAEETPKTKSTSIDSAHTTMVSMLCLVRTALLYPHYLM